MAVCVCRRAIQPRQLVYSARGKGRIILIPTDNSVGRDLNFPPSKTIHFKCLDLPACLPFPFSFLFVSLSLSLSFPHNDDIMIMVITNLSSAREICIVATPEEGGEIPAVFMHAGVLPSCGGIDGKRVVYLFMLTRQEA